MSDNHQHIVIPIKSAQFLYGVFCSNIVHGGICWHFIKRLIKAFLGVDITSCLGRSQTPLSFYDNSRAICNTTCAVEMYSINLPPGLSDDPADQSTFPFQGC